MSSERKDARWTLARKVAEAAGLDSINELPYPVSTNLLAACDAVLDQLPDDEIRRLAEDLS